MESETNIVFGRVFYFYYVLIKEQTYLHYLRFIPIQVWLNPTYGK